MKSILLSLGIFFVFLGCISIQKSFAAVPASLSGATNLQYACAPPFISQSAKPNIHFVLDKTGSMTEHPYVGADSTYDTSLGYWGYFKEDKYYKYDVSANNYWQENSACTNTDLIGSSNCVSGKLLNYVTSSKLDIMRKILTGGRVWASDPTVLEHETTYCGSGCDDPNIANEATTNCDFDNKTAGKLKISSPDPLSVSTTISTSSRNTTITVAKNTTRATFTRTSGSYSTTGIVAGTQIVTSGFNNAGNNGTWTVVSITPTVITVTTNTGIVNESKTRVTIKSATTLTGPVCKVLVNSVSVPITINSGSSTFTRTDTGSFLTEGWMTGMVFDSYGFSNSGNNKNNGSWTISTVTDKVITLSSGTLVSETAASARLTQNLTAYSRVKSTTAATDFTGLIQSMYIAPGNKDNKADLELSFYDSTGGIDYTGGDTSNNTVKNQPLVNYINAINLTGGSGGTNTGPALVVAEQFFQQASVSSGTVVPGSGTPLIAKGNGASDPYYDPPATGTPTTSNSVAATCRKSFVILVSDGEWNSGIDPVGPAYHMHRRDGNGTYDVRPDSTEPAMKGIQSVTTYTVYAFGQSAAGRNALITTAIFGGFDDVDNNGLPYPFTSSPGAPTSYPTTALKTALNTSGYTDSRQVAGSTALFFDDNATFPLDQCNPVVDADGTKHWNPSCAEWDKSPGPTPDDPTQRHTGLPYNYFEATDGAVLAQAMTNAVNDILARTSSSTAASILGNNDNAGASLVQALFYPEKQFDGTIKASWIGEVQAFWYYLDPRLNNVTIRDDTVSDLKLKLNEDKIAQFTFDGTYTKVNLYADANGDGSIDNPSSPDSTVNLEDVSNIWRAGKTLWSRAASDRLIYTNDPTVTAVTGSRIEFKDVAPSTTMATKLQPYLDVSTATGAVPTATDVMNYTRGTDISASYSVRQRAIQLGSITSTWKLGDVINSTPKMASEVRLNSYNLAAPGGYSDSSYGKYVKSKDYNSRGTAYLGANDGMLHAFKSGSNFSGSTQGIVAEIKNSDGNAATDLGKEMWAFIPKNVLPYLQYLMLPGYQHMYTVDGTPLLVDASIGMTNPNKSDGTSISNSCTVSTANSYHLCPLKTTVNTSTGLLDYTTTTNGGGTSWRTVLIESMGLGGASRNSGSTCTNCVKTPISNLGYSSFFALDVTNPISEAETDYPKLLWEFSDPRLGFSTVNPIVVRIKDTNDTASIPRNGRWAAIFASGPTGPITSSALAFEGRSDMPLTIFVVDLKTGELLRTFNNKACTDAVNSFDMNCSSIHTVVASMPNNAFAGSLSGSSIDTDKYNSTLPGAYSDDAVYIGYTKGNAATPTAWDNGGVLRLLTYNNYSPSNWKVSTVVDGIGPVTTSVTKLQDKTSHNLWLYFGTGRYFVKGDDPTFMRSIFGIKDSCYTTSDTFATDCDTNSAYAAPTVTAATSTSGASFTDLVDQTSSISAVATSKKGWKIDLGAASGSNYPKRVISNPVASTNGIITFITFTPSTDVCTYGGTTSVWALSYNTGGVGSANLKGQILIQLSTGAFQQVDVSSAFTQSLSRETTSFQGVPPKSEPAITTNANHSPSKRILHIQER